MKNYAIKEILGEGGFARVYLGIHKPTNTKVAIKIFPKTSEDNYITYFKNEIEILQKMNHPFVCKIYDVFETATNCYLVMEYIPNGTLLDFLNRNGPVDENYAAKMFAQILAAMKYVHDDCKIVHRDLKLENMLFDANRNIKLIDFGFSKLIQENSLLSTQCGSLLYCAPEVIKGIKYSYSVDIWSIGIILFSINAGYVPFQSQNAAQLAQRILYSDFDTPKKFSASLEDLIRKMLVKDPSERITLNEIINHPWIREEYKKLTESLYITHDFEKKKFGIEEEMKEANMVFLGSEPSSIMELHKTIPIIKKPTIVKVHIGKKPCITFPVAVMGGKRTPVQARIIKIDAE